MTENSEHAVSVLAVGEYATDRLLLHDISRRCGWRLFEARDRRHALECLERNPVQVVMAESEVRNWNWRKVLSDLRRLPMTPQLVVASRTADDYLWAEVLNVGGYDVLAQPLDRDEVERVIASARRHFDVRPRGVLPRAITPAASVA
jgi:PleD family two-component response regulator